MSDNVVKFPGDYYRDLPADEMLRKIADEKPDKVFVICWPKEGMPTYHSNTSDVPVILLRLQHFIHRVFNGDFGRI